MALVDYEEELEKPVTRDQYGKVKLEHLPDGDYKFEVSGLRIKDEQSLVALDLVIIGSANADLVGAKCERCYWLEEKVKVDGKATGEKRLSVREKGALDKDLTTLGFDVKEWTKANGRPWLLELKKAANCVKGVAFVGRKKQGGDRGQFANLYVDKRSSEDGRPATFTADDLKRASADPFAGGDEDDDKIPD